MEDYKEEIKILLSRYFKPTTTVKGIQYCSTAYVLKMLQGVIPSTPIDEHDVFEVLKELEFEQELHHFYKIDEESGVKTSEISSSSFLWKMYLI